MAVLSPRRRRLAGIAVDPILPRRDDVLPRMDVAIFAGFAASGPVNLPVAVEDVAEFTRIFGSDAPLAWDAERGSTVYAQLAPAVRAFFDNGGRRCWIIRLARNAHVNALRVPGVAAIINGMPEPLLLCARAPGSWSDGVALSASITSARFSGTLGKDGALQVRAPNVPPIVVGDLLRLTNSASDVEVYGAVAEVTPWSDTEAAMERVLGLRLDPLTVLERGITPDVAWTATVGGKKMDALVRPVLPSAASGSAAIELSATPEEAPEPGEIVVLRLGGDAAIVAVEEVTDVADDGASPPGQRVLVTGQARRVAAMPAGEMEWTIERIRLDLWAHTAADGLLRAIDLGLGPRHRRHVELLPDDARLYGGTRPDADVWADVVTPRLPAAGTPIPEGQLPDLCIPISLGALPVHYLSATVPDDVPLVRDGLGAFDATLFGDAALMDSRASTLLADGEYARFLGPVARPVLDGIHGALGIDEATIIAVPDATQRGWSRQDGVVISSAVTPPAAEAPPVCAPDDFVDCSAPPAPAPASLWATALPGGDRITLTWQSSEPNEFEVQEATSADWRGALTVKTSPATTVTLGGRAPGDHYFRVRGVKPATAWSDGVSVRLVPGGGWLTPSASDYDENVLIAVHRLLLRLASGRRDLIAVLSLPVHYSDDEAAAHLRHLSVPAATDVVPALTSGEADASSFGALYHGWTYVRDDLGLRALPPDGAVIGSMARRANERGAWIAPANEPLRGVLAVERPASTTGLLDLLERQVNVVRATPRGFAVLSEDTLASDDEIRPINVRRLLILLRRLATRLGADYVFEPNDDAFRRMVQRGFEAMLGDLFRRGAFAGPTAATAFEVITGDALNTDNTNDAGQFIVELRVAPSRPLSFLTLRLVQTGERVSVTGA
jgi:hypothetical protein